MADENQENGDYWSKLKEVAEDNENLMHFEMKPPDVVENIVEKGGIALIETAFDMLNKNNTGILTKDDLRKGFQVLGHNPTVQQVDDIMSELGITQIDFKGFERCIKALQTEECLQGERELKEAFRVFDKDGNGYIDKKELSVALKELGEHFTESEVEAMFSIADGNDDGKIQYDEIDFKGFERCMKALQTEECLQGERELKEAFRVFDKDGNGYIDKKELSVALKELGEHFTESEVEAMFSIADGNDDGKIQYDEFIRILTK